MKNLTTTQKNFLNITSKIVKLDKLSHSYLIEVNDEEDDMSFVFSFVKMILCSNKLYSYNMKCDEKCNICKLVDDGNYPDLKIIEADGQWIKKNQLLELKEEYQNKSLLNNKRIYIIKDASKLNPSSANTMLKFLEEPEENIIAILLTDNRYKILDTILSRCQILSLKGPLDNIEITEQLTCLLESILNGPQVFINYRKINESILTDKNVAKRIFMDIERIFISYLNYLSLSDVDFDKDLLRIMKGVSEEKIVKYITIIEEELSKLVYNVNYKLWLDSIFSKFVEVR